MILEWIRFLEHQGRRKGSVYSYQDGHIFPPMTQDHWPLHSYGQVIRVSVDWVHVVGCVGCMWWGVCTSGVYMCLYVLCVVTMYYFILDLQFTQF